SSTQPDPGKLDAFRTQLKGFLDYSWRKHRLHFWLNALIVLAGILLGASVILVGALNYGLQAAVLGAVISFLLGVQNAFKFAERANLWEIKHNEAKEIRDRLKYK